MNFENFSKHYSFSQEEKEKIIQQLKMLVEHIESDQWPLLIHYSCEKSGPGLIFNVAVSYPWGG